MTRPLLDGRVALVAVLALGSCALVRPAPPLFPSSAAVERRDFEADALGRPPTGLESSGAWSVADSPGAVSGRQVVVHKSDAPSELRVKEDKSHAAAGEVSVRIVLGSAGAGIACDADDGATIMKIEPDARRVVLYRRQGASTRILAEAPAALEKSKWVRLGIACGPEATVGYLDGKRVVRAAAARGPVSIALYTDGGVIAQFDDLRYERAASKGEVVGTAKP
jgi:hypothetical protein